MYASIYIYIYTHVHVSMQNTHIISNIIIHYDTLIESTVISLLSEDSDTLSIDKLLSSLPPWRRASCVKKDKT